MKMTKRILTFGGKPVMLIYLLALQQKECACVCSMALQKYGKHNVTHACIPCHTLTYQPHQSHIIGTFQHHISSYPHSTAHFYISPLTYALSFLSLMTDLTSHPRHSLTVLTYDRPHQPQHTLTHNPHHIHTHIHFLNYFIYIFIYFL